MRTKYLAFGIIGVATLLAAEPICKRIIIPTVQHHYSKKTIDGWTAYNAQRHIKPKAKAILAELDIICAEVKTQDVDQVGFILPTDTPTWVDTEVSVPVYSLTLADVTQYQFPAAAFSAALAPIPAQSQVPESGTLALFGIGLLAFAITAIHKEKQCFGTKVKR